MKDPYHAVLFLLGLYAGYTLLSPYIALRHFIFLLFQGSAIFVHFRGKIRYTLGRSLLDYQVLLAPVNTLLYLFSAIKPEPYIPVKQFPELKLIRDNYTIIRDEALALYASGSIKSATGYNDVGFNSFFRTGWTRFHIYWYGVEMASAKVSCPKTIRILKSIPSVKAAMFASLPPGKSLVRHRDPYAGSLRYHIGLFTPNDPKCFIDVDGERYFWQDGHDVMFDETYIHYAANETEHPRIILFCDIERPLLCPGVQVFNHIFGKYVMSLASSQNDTGETIGGLNVFFSYFYHIRHLFKRLKGSSRPLYYTLKWLTIFCLLYLLFW